MDILACTSTWCSFSNGDQRIIPLQCRILCLNFDGQSVVEPNGPSSRCLSPFPWHVTTRSITTTTKYGMPVKHKIIPQYFHQALLKIHQYSFILLGEERHCKCFHNTTQRPSFNPSHPNISMHILHTVLHRFPMVLTQGEFVEQSRASLVGDYFLYSHDLNVWFWADMVRRN